MRAVVVGLADLDTGPELSLVEAKARFGLAQGPVRGSERLLPLSASAKGEDPAG